MADEVKKTVEVYLKSMAGMKNKKKILYGFLIKFLKKFSCKYPQHLELKRAGPPVHQKNQPFMIRTISF